MRPFGSSAVYSRLDYYPGYPYCFNRYDVEISILRFLIIPHATEVGIYRSPVVSIGDLCSAANRFTEYTTLQFLHKRQCLKSVSNM